LRFIKYSQAGLNQMGGLSMRIAALSDIHGNSIALEAVLDDLAHQGDVDQIVVAGDFFAPGSDTHEVFDLLQELPQPYFVSGNADRYLVEQSYNTVYSPDGWQGTLRRAFHWTDQQLSKAEWQFLESLPFAQQFKAGGQQILVVHGSPRSDEEGLTPNTQPADFNRMSVDHAVSLIICGHTHEPMNRIIGGIRVVNIGSAGLPFDGDPRACYAIISNVGDSFSVEMRRVAYDIERAIQRLYAVEHPAAEMGAYNLRHGRPKGATDVYTNESVL
jgi:putative phosphoesterase